MALGLSIAMILTGIAGITKLTILSRRAQQQVPHENSVISLYLEEDELLALEDR